MSSSKNPTKETPQTKKLLKLLKSVFQKNSAKLCEPFEKLCVTIPKQTKRIHTYQRLTKSIRVIRVTTHKTSTTDKYHIILN